MATFNRPAALPLWCEDNQANVVQPPATLTQAGYTDGEIPVASHFNAIFNSIGHWVAYLDQATGSSIMATTLDMNTRLLEGGHWSFDAVSRTLSWDAPALLAIPGASTADNTLPAGSAVLAAGQALAVSANVPYTSPVDVTQGSANLANVLVPSQISVGQLVSGAGIPANTTVTAISDSTVTLSQAATATNQQVPVTFVGTGPLAPSVVTMATFTPSPAAVIIALAQANTCAIGANTNQMLLRHQESKRLLGSTGYASGVEAPAGQTLTAGQAVYVSAGTPDGRTLGAVYPCDASTANGANRNQFIGFVPMAYSAGDNAHVVTSGIVNSFSGLSVGAGYFLSPTTPGGITTARPNSPGQYAVSVGQAVGTASLNVFAAGGRSNSAIPTGDQEVTGNLQVDGAATLKGRLYTPGGIKTVVPMGALWTTSWANNDEQGLRITLANFAGSNQVGVMDRYWPASHAGSVVGISIWYYSSAAQGANVNIRLNRNTILTNVALPAPPAATWALYTQQFPVGQLAFSANQTLLLTVLNFANGANVQISGELTVELST